MIVAEVDEDDVTGGDPDLLVHLATDMAEALDVVDAGSLAAAVAEHAHDLGVFLAILLEDELSLLVVGLVLPPLPILPSISLVIRQFLRLGRHHHPLPSFQGLKITTNKISDEEMYGVPHHLLGVLDLESDFSTANFCAMTSISLCSILSRRQLPIVGGSNSFLEALTDVNLRSRYICCFLWVDFAMPVLHSFVSGRVDRMVERGIPIAARRGELGLWRTRSTRSR